ncbi:uncharacterized protein BROUX77_005492 [Berkeleyomyces rouxiae]|uniref:uncharacterized protein n=1 Tax=Berkeleyomyces rouxiae TaxID=2035830 RepID=UPI003B764391
MSHSSGPAYSTSQRYNPLPINRTSVAASKNSTTYTQTATRGPYYSPPVSEGRTPRAYSQNCDYYEMEPSTKRDTAADGVNARFPEDDDEEEEIDSDDQEEPKRRGKGVKWSSAEDLLLEELRRRRGRWSEVSKKFKGKSANACRKRYERIQQRKVASERNAALDKTHVAVAYWEVREEMWKILESRMPGVKWEKLERMCFEMGENEIRKRWRDATSKPLTEASVPHSAAHVSLIDGTMPMAIAPVYSQPQSSTSHMQSLLVSEPATSYNPSAVAMMSQPTGYAMPGLSSAGFYPPGLHQSQNQQQPHYRPAMHHAQAQAQSQAYAQEMMGPKHMGSSYLEHSGVNDADFDSQRLPTASDMGIDALVNRPPGNM